MQPADCPVGAPDTRLLSGTLCFVARDMAVRVHRHHCLQLLLALRGSFTSVVGATTYDHQQSRLFASDVAHACDATGCEALVFFVEPTSAFGRALLPLLAQGDGQTASLPGALAERLRAIATRSSEVPDVAVVIEVIGAIAHRNGGGMVSTSAEGDARITAAIDWVEHHLGESFDSAAVARCVGLSGERFRHLFAQHTQMPFRQWVLWRRLRHVRARVLGDGFTLTDAALEAGFADQAHFCRVFARRFGIAASGLLQNSRNVQFIVPVAR